MLKLDGNLSAIELNDESNSRRDPGVGASSHLVGFCSFLSGSEGSVVRRKPSIQASVSAFRRALFRYNLLP
jgi:hypothetical protein